MLAPANRADERQRPGGALARRLLETQDGEPLARGQRRRLGQRIAARQLSRMNPWRAALTSATASGKSTRIASR